MNSEALLAMNQAVRKIQTTQLKMILMIRIFTFPKQQYVNLIFLGSFFSFTFHSPFSYRSLFDGSAAPPQPPLTHLTPLSKNSSRHARLALLLLSVSPPADSPLLSSPRDINGLSAGLSPSGFHVCLCVVFFLIFIEETRENLIFRIFLLLSLEGKREEEEEGRKK